MRKPLMLGAALALMTSACSAPRPIVYPNAQSQRVGQAQVEADIAACRQLAEQAGAREGAGAASERAATTARGGAIGAA
ncbi:MAG: hypothetical protein RLW42_04460, partial [Gammaproteobacteria bacterium]